MPKKKAVSVPVSAYLRKLKDGRAFWYASWYEDGKRVVRPTAEEYNAKRKNGGRDQAVEIGRRLRDEREADRQPEVPTLDKYAKGFYAPDSDYLKRQAQKKRSLNAHWAHSLQAMIDKYVLPEWGSSRLDSINPVDVETWLTGLELSNQTKRHMLYGLRTILREATRARIILQNPLQETEAPVKDGRVRDIFSLDEYQLLFPSTREGLLSVWKYPKYAALFLTMATTRIREGEARALQWRHVLPNGWLVVGRAVKEDGTIGTPKNGKSRVAMIPSRAAAALEWWHGESLFTAPEDLVFYGASADKWINRRTFCDIFNRALDGEHRKDESKPARIIREGRFLTTHSLRHGYNTLTRLNLSEDTLLALMGHADSRMSDHYDHATIENRIKALEGNRPAIEAIFQ